MHFLKSKVKDQSGFTIVVVIMILALLTILGTAAITTSSTELQTSSSEELYKMAFFAAESGVTYVRQNPDLYHVNNIIENQSLSFPDTDDEAVKYNLGSLQSFNGTTGYLGSSAVPRGSGYEVGTYKAHDYQIISEGFGPRDSKVRIDAGFYRIGL